MVFTLTERGKGDWGILSYYSSIGGNFEVDSSDGENINDVTASLCEKITQSPCITSYLKCVLHSEFEVRAGSLVLPLPTQAFTGARIGSCALSRFYYQRARNSREEVTEIGKRTPNVPETCRLAQTCVYGHSSSGTRRISIFGLWTRGARSQQMEAARSLVFVGAVLLGVTGSSGREGG